MSDLSHPLNPIAGILSGRHEAPVLWPAPLEGGYPAWAPRDGGLPCIVESRIGRRYGGQLTALDLSGQVALLRSNRGPQVVTLRFDQVRSLTLGERLQPTDPAAPRPPTRPLTLGHARGPRMQLEALSPLTLGGGVFVYQPVDASAQLQCSFHPGLQVIDTEPPPAADVADTLPAALMRESPEEDAPDASSQRPMAPPSVATVPPWNGGADAAGAADDDASRDEAPDIDRATRRTVVAPLAAWVERAAQAEQARADGGLQAALSATCAPGGQTLPTLAAAPGSQDSAAPRRPSGREPTLTDELPADSLPAWRAAHPADRPPGRAAHGLLPAGGRDSRSDLALPGERSPRPAPPDVTATAIHGPAPDASTAGVTTTAVVDTRSATAEATARLLAEAPTLPMSFDLGEIADAPSAVHDATLPMPRHERPAAAGPQPAEPGDPGTPTTAGPTAASDWRLPRLDSAISFAATDLLAPSALQPEIPVAFQRPSVAQMAERAATAATPPPTVEPPVRLQAAATLVTETRPRPGHTTPAAEPLPTVQDLATLHARLDAPSAPAMRLGEALMALGALSESQLGDALQAQARGSGLALGELLLRQGLIDRDTLRTALTCKLGYVAVDLDTLTPQDDALQALPAAQCRQHRALPLCWHGDALVVALDDPSARIVVDRLEQQAQAPVRAVACDAVALDEALARLPDDRAPAGRARSAPAGTSGDPAGPDAPVPAIDDATPGKPGEGRAPLAALDPDDEDLLADRLIAAALDAQAEDLHIHCESQGVALQLRQAGALRPWHSLPAAAAVPLMRRLHQLAGIDEPRPATPATHGRIALSRCLPGQRGEVRLQTLRRADGGRDGVLRLPATAPRSGLAALGLSPTLQDELRQTLGRPGGLLLRVGTAGSGRRTGVRAMLAELASPHRRLWQGLAEDQDAAVERSGLRQVRLRPQQGWSAESALKALAHADADVVAIEGLDAPADLLAALQLARSTPTRVLGTLGAADALDALARLQAAGAPGWALADGLRGLWSSRLLPRCCPACRQARPAGPEWEQALLRLWSEDATRGEPGAETQLRRWRAEFGRDGHLLQWSAPGCARCEGRGTEGWVGVHELLLPGAGLRQALREGQPAGGWWTVARADGWQPLRRDLLLKLLTGQLPADALHACG